MRANWSNACCCKHLKSIQQTHGCNTDVFHSEKVEKKKNPTTLQLVVFETSLFTPFSSVLKHVWWGHRFEKKTTTTTSQMMVNNRNEKRNTSAVNDTT